MLDVALIISSVNLDLGLIEHLKGKGKLKTIVSDDLKSVLSKDVLDKGRKVFVCRLNDLAILVDSLADVKNCKNRGNCNPDR